MEIYVCPLAARGLVLYLANTLLLALMELAKGVVAEQTNAGQPCLLPKGLSFPHSEADVAVFERICHILLLAKSEIECGIGHGEESYGKG